MRIATQGSGTPTHTAPRGSLYFDTATGRLWKQTAGPTGDTWVRIADFAEIPDTSGLVPNARQVATQHSLTGGGNLSADRTLALVNDAASPGNSKVYGTDGSGNKGWRDEQTISGVLLAPNNLNDVDDAADARANLGLANVLKTMSLNITVAQLKALGAVEGGVFNFPTALPARAWPISFRARMDPGKDGNITTSVGTFASINMVPRLTGQANFGVTINSLHIEDRRGQGLYGNGSITKPDYPYEDGFTPGLYVFLVNPQGGCNMSTLNDNDAVFLCEMLYCEIG